MSKEILDIIAVELNKAIEDKNVKLMDVLSKVYQRVGYVVQSEQYFDSRKKVSPAKECE